MATIDKKYFYDTLRKSLFSKGYSQKQVSGLEAIISNFNYSYDKRWLAYMLATAFHETAFTMQPITEYGPKAYFDKYDTGKIAKALGNTPQADGDGFTFRGRGYVQLTGRANYDKASKKLGVDFVNNPDLALNPIYAFKIMDIGMREGWFTGVKLSTYFNTKTDSPVNARKIINGTDKASTIAGYHAKFLAAIKVV